MSTGRIAVGRVVLDVGAPEGAIVAKMRVRKADPPAWLVEALAADSGPLAAAEGAIEDAEEVTSRIERLTTLLEQVVRGQLDVATIAGELERALATLTRLYGARRYGEVLRLARVLVRLLTLAMSWHALVGTLRTAAHAARELADSEALSWVLHELGTLALGAEDAQAATRDLEESRRLRAAQGDPAALRATQHNLRAARRPPASMLLRVGAPALALGIVLALVIAGSSGDDDTPRETVASDTTETTSPPPPPPPPPPAGGDVTAPRPTLELGRGTRELTNDPTPGFSGVAGTADGDEPTITLQVFRGAEATGDPVDEVPRRRGAGGRFTVATGELRSGRYTIRAEQRDEAGNVGTSPPLTISIDRDKPLLTLDSPKDKAVFTGSTVFRGTAGRAEGDGEQVTLTLSRGESPVAVDVSAGGSWERTLDLPPEFDQESESYVPVSATVTQVDAAGNEAAIQVTFTPTPVE